MPQVGSSSTDDLASSDEIKVFEDEGDEEKPTSSDLTDLKSSLITEGDQGKSSQAFSSKSSNSQQPSSHHQNGQRTESTSNFGKVFETPLGYSPFGYLSHSPYHSNATIMANKMAAAAAAGVVGAPHSASPLSFMMPNMEGFPQPPPAHMGITSPVMRCEPKANMNVNIGMFHMDIDLTGISRNLYNPLSGPQYPHVLSDLTQQLQWNPSTMYQQLHSAAFRGQYPLPPVSSPAFPSFGRTPLIHPSLSGHTFPHPNFLPSTTPSNASANSCLSNGLSNGSKGLNGVTNGSSAHSHMNGTSGECRIKQEHSPQPVNSSNRQSSVNSPSANSHDSSNNNNPGVSNKNRSNNDFSDNKLQKGSPASRSHSANGSDRESTNHKGHIKKPLNAFMIYMKEMRAKVIAESTLKESAAINQILGKKWHSLSRVEQEKYYDKARKERELHLELHPGWTAKDNYAINAKRKKKKRERNADGERGALKKCRARYGLDQQNAWCKPCRRKKKCIRYLEAARALAQGGEPRNDDDNLGSVGSVEAPTPDSKSSSESEHDNLNSNDLSLSSPPTYEYHNFMSAFNPFSSGSCINSPPNLHLNGHSNGHLPSPSLFSPYHHTSSSLNSIGSRMSSLLTPNSPLTSLSNFSSASLLAPSIGQAPHTPSQMPPRNSPFSIEQLARPHCPQNRSSPSSSSSSSKLLSSSSHSKSNGPVTMSGIQLPTPPSSTDSTTPTMLSVA